MSLLDNLNTPPPAAEPEEEFNEEDFEGMEPDLEAGITTGDLNGYLAEFNQPKEDLGVDEEPTASEMEESNRPMLSGKKCRQTAKFLSNTVDTMAAYGLSMISTEDYHVHKADSEALKDLENIICEYLKETGADIPLGLQAIICIFTLYVVQVPGALAIRKQKREAEQMERARMYADEVIDDDEQDNPEFTTVNQTEEKAPESTEKE